MSAVKDVPVAGAARERALGRSGEPEAARDLRARAAAGGLDGCTAEEALTLFLLRAAGKATGELARRLLARFGSLPEVLGAPEPELRQVVPPAVARDLRLLHELQLRALREPFRTRPVLTSTRAVQDWLRTAMAALPREQFRVLFLDRRNQLIADEVMGHGTICHAPVYPREVVRRALELSAAAVVLAHNHPSGDPQPSAADVEMTAQVVAACRALGIAVHDHVVVGGGRTASLRDLGLMS
jgi:DNA repair protein RadC